MRVAVWAIGAMAVACAPPPPPPKVSDGGTVVSGDRVSATVLLGTFDRGYGTVGLSMLTVLADEDGSEWNGEVLDDRDQVLAAFAYGAGDRAQPVATWWPTIPAAYGATYKVRFFEPGGRMVEVKSRLAATSGLAVPVLELSADGTRVEWPPVTGAVAYDCSEHPGIVSEHVLSPGCRASTEETTVRAFNVDLSTQLIPADLPRSFDVSEASWASARGSSGARLRGALGSIQYTSVGLGFAALVSIQTATGAAPSVAWDVDVTGPAFGVGGALQGVQLAGTDRLILWTYDVAPVDGIYVIRARAAGETISLSLRAAPTASLPEVAGPTAMPRGAGGAEVSWQAVPGARAYYVSAWARATGALLAAAWVTQTSATFAPGTFASSQSCDVYVAASTADPATGGVLPSVLSISENTYRPVSFVAN